MTVQPIKQTEIADAGLLSAQGYAERLINLRDELKTEIPSTTYLTHAIHNVYPAKFIPQVPRFVIKTFNLRDKIILDPFAGSGTTAVESLITGNSNISNDINPLTSFLIDVKTMRLDPQQYFTYRSKLNYFIDSIFKSNAPFFPKWSNLHYWYPEDILQVLLKVWGGIHGIDEREREIKNLLKTAMLFISRKYCYGEDKSPKLFKSKHKTERIKELLDQFHFSGEQLLQNELLKKSKKYLDCVIELNSSHALGYNKANSMANQKGLFLLTLTKSIEDLGHVLPDSSVDCIITSPPYIYAQEYFRSTKIDLYWLGLADDKSVKELTQKEIGQKRHAFYIDDALSRIKTYRCDFEIIKDLSRNFKTGENVSRFSAYFGDMLYFVQLSSKVLKRNGMLAVLVGESKVFGHHVKVKDILAEMMLLNGFDIRHKFFDTIKGRHLSRNRLNENPEGIAGEWLIIGEKS